MPDKHITSQGYGFTAVLVEVAEVGDDHLCGSRPFSFIVAICLIVAIGFSAMAAGTAWLRSGAEEAVYRRAALIKASAPVSGWGR